MLKSAKKAVKSALCSIVRSYRDSKLIKWHHQRSQALVQAHQEWTALTPQEKSSIRDKDYGQYTAYKNVWGKLDEGFVSDPLYLQILRVINANKYTSIGEDTSDYDTFSNKNYFALMLKHLQLPQTVIMSINGEFLDADYSLITKESALEKMNVHSQLVFKPAAGTGHGTHVSKVERKDFEQKLSEYAGFTEGGGDFIVQEILKQHESFRRFNSSSVNVIRITTLFWKGEIYILGSILRVGAPGEFCDHTKPKDGTPPRKYVVLDDDGRITGKVIYPDTLTPYDPRNDQIQGIIPKFREMKRLVVEEHSHFPHHRIIGWDITLDENENITCIEYNPGWPGVINLQYALGPIFMQKSSRGVPLLYEILDGK